MFFTVMAFSDSLRLAVIKVQEEEPYIVRPGSCCRGSFGFRQVATRKVLEV